MIRKGVILQTEEIVGICVYTDKVRSIYVAQLHT